MIQNYQLVFQIMESLGKKWIAPVLIFLFIYEEATFSRMKKSLKITSRSLSKKLKLLEALGLVEKIVIEKSRKACYSLSHKGKKVSGIIVSLENGISNS